MISFELYSVNGKLNLSPIGSITVGTGCLLDVTETFDCCSRQLFYCFDFRYYKPILPADQSGGNKDITLITQYDGLRPDSR